MCSDVVVDWSVRGPQVSLWGLHDCSVNLKQWPCVFINCRYMRDSTICSFNVCTSNLISLLSVQSILFSPGCANPQQPSISVFTISLHWITGNDISLLHAFMYLFSFFYMDFGKFENIFKLLRTRLDSHKPQERRKSFSLFHLSKCKTDISEILSALEFPGRLSASITTASSSPATLMSFLSSQGKWLSSDKSVFSSLKNRFLCEHQAIYTSLKKPHFSSPLPGPFCWFYCILEKKKTSWAVCASSSVFIQS